MCHLETGMVSRIAHELYLLGVPLIPRIMTEYAHTETRIDIHPGATIGALSTRGGQKLFGKKRHPTIEDDVLLLQPQFPVIHGSALKIRNWNINRGRAMLKKLSKVKSGTT